MALSPNERPIIDTSIAPTSKEPFAAYFNLWVDVYDLVNCDEAKKGSLWVVATIGSKDTGIFQAKYNSKSDSFQWKKIQMKALRVNFPVDMRQTPDIIINVYSEKAFKGDYRLGYIRLPARDCASQVSRP